MHFSCNMKAPYAKKTKQYDQCWKQLPKATIPNILIPSDTMYTLQVIRRKGPNKQKLVPVIEWWNKQPVRDGRMATERTWTTAYTTLTESDNANIYMHDHKDNISIDKDNKERNNTNSDQKERDNISKDNIYTVVTTQVLTTDTCKQTT